ncbi:hypothetical protein H7F28_14410 [Brevibacterium sp. PAMC23299]|nr:hypothetical protein H7F28_14410 [Brevibacterium sp. PAMC23299]
MESWKPIQIDGKKVSEAKEYTDKDRKDIVYYTEIFFTDGTVLANWIDDNDVWVRLFNIEEYKVIRDAKLKEFGIDIEELNVIEIPINGKTIVKSYLIEFGVNDLHVGVDMIFTDLSVLIYGVFSSDEVLNHIIKNFEDWLDENFVDNHIESCEKVINNSNSSAACYTITLTNETELTITLIDRENLTYIINAIDGFIINELVLERINKILIEELEDFID